MDFKIIWTDPAIEALHEIVGHIAEANIPAAIRLGSQLIEHMELAAHFPQMGPLYSQSESGEIRCLTHASYRLYDRVSRVSSAIEVVAVWHAARAQPRF